MSFVEYGSGDSSIILQSSLCSQADVLSPAVGPSGAEKTEADIDYDSTLGMTIADGSNAVVSWTDATVFGQMNNQYQYSFEIETAFIAERNTDATGAICGSQGIEHSSAVSNFAATVLSNTAGSATYGKFYPFRQSANDSWWMRAMQQNLTGTSSEGIHTIGKDRFCTVTVSVMGDRIWLYIDKGLIDVADNAHQGSVIERFFAGSDRGNTNRGLHSGYRMRNLVVSTRPVCLPVTPKLRKIVFIGDSFTNQAGAAIGSTIFDATVEVSLQRVLQKKGLGIGQQVFQSVSGGTWENDGTTIQAVVADAIAEDGDIYVLYGGWNDCAKNSGASINAAVTTDYQDVISSIITGTRASAILCINQTAFQGLSTHPGSTYNPNVARFNAIVDASPAYAETVESGWGDKTFVVDAFTATGGNGMPANYTKGGLSGADDDQHPSANQTTIVGELIGNTILSKVLG